MTRLTKKTRKWTWYQIIAMDEKSHLKGQDKKTKTRKLPQKMKKLTKNDHRK